jgi:hypothetical protein
MGEILKEYTEEELRRAYIGKYVDSQIGYGREDKKRCYRDQGVWMIYGKLRSYYRRIVTDETGWVDHDLATRMAQRQVDTYLLLRSRGTPVTEPKVPGEEAASHSEEGKDLFDITEFKNGDGIDPIGMLTWVFNNLAVKGIKPGEAPSPGAFAYLRFVQQSHENQVDFYTKVLPRIIPAKSTMEDQNKFRDDGRTNFDLLDRVFSEIKQDSK